MSSDNPKWVDWAVWIVGILAVALLIAQWGEGSNPGYPEDCIVEYWQTGPSCG